MEDTERLYTSKRYSILEALTEKLREIDGSEEYTTTLWNQVYPQMKFWDEIEEFPAVFMALGTESRIYQGGGYKDRFLNILIRFYVRTENPQRALEGLLEDIETVLEKNGRLAYQDSSGRTQFTQDILVLSIDTDEGALAPVGAGDMTIQVRY